MMDKIRIRNILNKWKSDDYSKIDELEMLSLFHQKKIETEVKKQLMKDLINVAFDMNEEHLVLEYTYEKILQKISN